VSYIVNDMLCDTQFFYSIYDYSVIQILLNHNRTIIVTCDSYGKNQS
jgi:hypothetical protein